MILVHTEQLTGAKICVAHVSTNLQKNIITSCSRMAKTGHFRHLNFFMVSSHHYMTPG